MTFRQPRGSANALGDVLHGGGLPEENMRHGGLACQSQRKEHFAMHIPHAATLPPDTLSSANVARLMVVDDAIDLMATLKKMRPETEYEAVGFTSGKAALAALQEREFDLCLVNLMLPDMDGIALLTAAQAIDPHMIGIIMTGQGDVETAVEAMKAGAYDYVVKPLKWQTLMQ